MLVSRVKMVRFKTEMTQFRTCRRGESGKRRGLVTEKRCSHKLQSGHPAWSSADNCSIFPTVNILIEARSEPTEEMIENLKKTISCIFVFLAYRIYLLVLKLRGKLNCNRVRS